MSFHNKLVWFLFLNIVYQLLSVNLWSTHGNHFSNNDFFWLWSVWGGASVNTPFIEVNTPVINYDGVIGSYWNFYSFDSAPITKNFLNLATLSSTYHIILIGQFFFHFTLALQDYSLLKVTTLFIYILTWYMFRTITLVKIIF